MNDTNDVPTQPARRGFLKKLCATVIGALVMLVPIGAGLSVLFDPLRRKSKAGGYLLVTSLGALPEDGMPRKFSVIANHSDAWNRNPDVPIGAVYLRRTADNKVKAFNVVCPHLGCFVDYVAARKGFLCPCHNSTFALDGRIGDPKSPSERGLDELPVEIREGNEIWVKFQNFRPGGKTKIPLA